MLKTLISPNRARAKVPLTKEVTALVSKTRQAIRDILHGRDRRRLVVVVGPCSIHDPEAAYEYARTLKRVADAVHDQLVVVMRTYFEKPRTIVGWKGLIHDPHLDDSCDIATGLELARTILLKINQLGVPCGGELLSAITPQYIVDLLSWAVIGARTSESQIHREMASGLPVPVGFKNSTNGDIEVPLNAMISARHSHSFLGINSEGVLSVIKTCGNPDRHMILRGGEAKSNYGPADVAYAAVLAAGEGLARPIMIDCSHGNSRKEHTRQGEVCQEVLEQVVAGQQAIMGLLLESNLKTGKQVFRKGVKLAYGVSITDACIGWEETEELLYKTAEAVRRRDAKPNKQGINIQTAGSEKAPAVRGHQLPVTL